MSGVIAAGAAVAVVGGAYSANAAGNAAREQGAAARGWADQSAARAAQGLQDYNNYVPSQQAAIDKAMAYQQQNIQRQQTLVDSIDPALLDAGKQMQQLLNGQSAPVIKNFLDQRNLQKQQMLDGLRQQMGPGAETSSMGQNMLMKFDQETANMQNSIQQQYLDKVSNLAIGGGQTLSDVMGKASTTLAGLGDQLGQIGLNQANILNGGTAAMNASQQAVVNAAGGEQKANQLIGQGIQQAGSTVMLGGLMNNMQAPAAGANAKSATLGSAMGGSTGLTMPEFGSSAGFNQPTNYGLGLGQSSPSSINFSGGAQTLNSAVGVPSFLNPNSGYSANSGQYQTPTMGDLFPGGSRQAGGFN